MRRGFKPRRWLYSLLLYTITRGGITSHPPCALTVQRLSIIFYIWGYPRYYTITLGFRLWPPPYLGITIDFRATPLCTLFTLSFFGDHPQNTCILDIPGTYGSAAILLTNHATAGILFTNHTYFVHKPRYSSYFAHKPR